MAHTSPIKTVITPSDLVARARSIAATVASTHACDIDRSARFPAETIQAARDARLLSAPVPAASGGFDASMRDLAAICTALAQSCGASGMVMAMHFIQVACIARHSSSSPFFAGYLNEVAESQRLIASVTSEVGTGGDTRSSICALEREAGRFTLTKDATTVSYGEYADDLLVTCRASLRAPPGDQALVLLRKGDFELQRTSDWDTLGMRGTCSPGYKLSSSAPEIQILPASFAEISEQSMVPYSHILWSAVWLGIAGEAVARAASYVRAEARKKPGTPPATATLLAELSTMLQSFRYTVTALADEFDAFGGALEPLSTMAWALKMNNLKVASSEIAPQIVHKALQVVGILGYKNDSPFSVGRNYRDSLSASLMIANHRIASKNASMLLVLKDEP